MSYEKWSSPVMLLPYAKWYRAKDLLSFVSDIRNINWHIVKERDDAYARLNYISTSCPFNKDVRFPREYYICEAKSIWTKVLQQLRASLQHVGPNDYENMKISLDIFSNENAAYQSFSEITNTIIENIISCTGVYYQALFEKDMCLKWIEPRKESRYQDSD